MFLCGQQHDSLSVHHAHSLDMPFLYDDVCFPDSKYCAVQMLFTDGITYSSLVCLTAKKVINECVCHEQVRQVVRFRTSAQHPGSERNLEKKIGKACSESAFSLHMTCCVFSKAGSFSQNLLEWSQISCP